jgi:type I restriction enzyme R subunit
VTLEETGANTETDKQFIYNTYTALLKDVERKPGKSKTETYEDQAKELFNQAAGQHEAAGGGGQAADRLRRTALHLPLHRQVMQDHGLFQAICRTNRLDGDDKDFGYIVDYKDLFKKVNENGHRRSIPPSWTTARAAPTPRCCCRTA